MPGAGDLHGSAPFYGAIAFVRHSQEGALPDIQFLPFPEMFGYRRAQIKPVRRSIREFTYSRIALKSQALGRYDFPISMPPHLLGLLRIFASSILSLRMCLTENDVV